MQCQNPSPECSVLCPLTGKPYCFNCSCPGGPVCKGDTRSAERYITCYPNDEALAKRKLQAKFTGIPQGVAMKPSPTSVTSCAHHPDFSDGVRRQLFHSSRVTEPESDYGLQFLRDTTEEDPSPRLVSPSTPPLGSIRVCIPPPGPSKCPLDPPQQDSRHAYDDTETQNRLRNQQAVLPPTNSLPLRCSQSPHQVPGFENFVLPMSWEQFGFPNSIRRDPQLHGLIEQHEPEHETAPRNETIANRQLVASVPGTSQQVVPLRDAEHQDINTSSTGGTADEDLPSLTMKFQPPELKKMTIKTATECLRIGDLILKKRGVEYAKKGRRTRKQELKNHRAKLEGRIGKKLKCAKREGDKFFHTLRGEVRKVFRDDVIVPNFNKFPIQKKKHTVDAPVQKQVPFKRGLLQVPALPPEASKLVLDDIDVRTRDDLAKWLQKLQEESVPAFLRKRSKAVRKAFNDARDKNKKKKDLRDEIEAKIKAVDRADLEVTHWFIFEYFVKIGFS